MQLLAKAGVGIPKTVVSRNSADIDDLIEKIGGTPVIIKLARGTHGNGVVLAETKKAAKSVLQAFYLQNEDGTNILLQEFVKESAGTDIRAFVVGGRVVASMKRQSLDDDFRSNLHKNNENTKKTSIAEILMKKHHNGPTKKIDLYFDDKHTSFRDLDKGHSGMAGGADAFDDIF
jgi:RimK family alpha-L-glutamate ligase